MKVINAGRGKPPSTLNQEWIDAGRALRQDAFKRLEDTAKEVIGLVTLLSGIYFHAIAFSQIRGATRT